MSLLECLPYPELKLAEEFTPIQCNFISRLANLDKVYGGEKPGSQLLKDLHSIGYTVRQYQYFLRKLRSSDEIPHSKIAILIGNDKYKNLDTLVTPSHDCELLAQGLKSLGFVVVVLKDMDTEDTKNVLPKIFDSFPQGSYCFIYYAGHGIEVCNNKFMLGVECPKTQIAKQHCISENFILEQVSKCKLKLCVFVLDMCRNTIDRSLNPGINDAILSVEEYTINCDLIITYTTAPNSKSYEVALVSESRLDSDATSFVSYQMTSSDKIQIEPDGSKYLSFLCKNLNENLTVNALLDKVHSELDAWTKIDQTPVKLQCRITNASLLDPTLGKPVEVANKLKEVIGNYNGCQVLDV